MIKKIGSVNKRLHKNCITSISVDGNNICTGGKDSTVILLDYHHPDISLIRRVSLLEENIVRCNITSVDFKNPVIVCGTNGGLVYVIDSLGGSINRIAAHSASVSCVKHLSMERYLVVSSSFDKRSKIWDIRHTMTPLYELIGHTANVNFCDSFPFIVQNDEHTVSFGDSYERILTVASDRTARLWNVSFIGICYMLNKYKCCVHFLCILYIIIHLYLFI